MKITAVYLELLWEVMRYIKEFFRFIKQVIKGRKLISILSYSDFKEQYLGSYIGVFWAILRPLMFIGIVWFVFGMGFKAKPVDNGVPFILWLLCGFIPWFFFADAMSKSMNAITGNKFLVKKVAFRVSFLPLVKVISSLYIHIIFVLILIFIFLLYGYTPTIFWLQIPYFMMCTIFLLLGLSWLTSALKVFIKDIGEVVGVLIQFGFWLTPIFWSIDIIPEQYQSFFRLNPMFYIVDGYRNALLHEIWFFENGSQSLHFLIITGIILVFGAIVFKRLRPHFGDVI